MISAMVFVVPEKLKVVDAGTQQQRRHTMKLTITHQRPEFYQYRLTRIQTQILNLLTKKSKASRCKPKVCGVFQGKSVCLSCSPPSLTLDHVIQVESALE